MKYLRILAGCLVASACTFALAEVFFYSFFWHNNLPYLNLLPFSSAGRVDWGQFIDLRVITDNAYGCDKPLATIHTNDCYFNATNVPSFLIGLFRFLGLGASETPLVGFVLGTCIVLLPLVYFGFASLSLYELSAAYPTFVLSYPLRLMIERGNIDGIILVLVAASTFFLALYACRESFASSIFFYVSLILILLASLSKVYPCVLFVLLLISPLIAGKSQSFLSLIRVPTPQYFWSVFSLCLFVVVTVQTLPHILSQTPQDLTGGWAYGFRSLPEPDLSSFFQYLVKTIFLAAPFTFSNAVSDGLNRLRSFMFCRQLGVSVPLPKASCQAVYFSYYMSVFSFIAGTLLLCITYFPFLNTYYRVAVPLFFLIPLSISWVRASFLSRSPFAWPAVLWVSISSLLLFGYRSGGVNLYHYSNVFFQLILQPLFVSLCVLVSIQLILWAPPSSLKSSTL